MSFPENQPSRADDVDRLAPFSFLEGGGDMGGLMRAMDWSRTSLVPPEHWPQSLRSALSICLGSGFPIAIYWGPMLALLYNDAWRPIPGVKHPSALGRPAREVWPEIWDTIGPLFERVMLTGEATRSKDQLLPMRRHGYIEECYFDYTFSPIRAEDGSVGGIFNAVVETTFRVIGERRTRLLQALGEQVSASRSADDLCALAAEVLNSDRADIPFCLLYLADGHGGARLAGTTGLPPGLTISPKTIDPADPAAPWPLVSVLAHGVAEMAEGLAEQLGSSMLSDAPWPEPVEHAIVVPLAGVGTNKPVGAIIVGISPRLTLDDEYRGFIGRAAAQLATALTNAQAYEQERRRAEALAEIDHAKTLFFSNVSHEFRTPLTLMLGPLEDALNDASSNALPAVQRERLDVAHRNSLRLLKLVNTLLDFSRIEAGRVQASYRPTDLAALTADLTAGFRSATERAGLSLTIDCPPLSQSVFIDRDMWEKLVLNLLSNAFKFTFVGGIVVTLHADGGRTVLTVRDSGVGIPKHELPRVFERFHRIEGQQSRSFEGSGIGLALVHELVRLHGGSITAESEPGEGTTFTVVVPFGTAHLPREQIGTVPNVPATVRTEAYVEEALRWLPDMDAGGIDLATTTCLTDAESIPGVPRSLVLLADDNADMRDYVRRLLGGRYDVSAVADGEAALVAIRRQRPDLVLTDVMMPGLDGFGLVRAIRTDPGLRDLPVILLSARAGEEARAEGLDAGADDYLIKPFSARELVARVGANLATARIRREALQATLDSAERLQQMFEQAPGFMCLLHGPEHVYELANAAYMRLIGFREVIGKPVRDVVPEVENQGFFDLLDRVYGTGEPFVGHGMRTTLRQNDALVERFLDFVYQPIRDVAGNVVGLFVEGADVTERVRAEAALREANEQLEARVSERTAELRHALDQLHAEALERQRAEEALRQSQKMEAVGQLTGGLAHDFNNLLTGISGSLELLQTRIAQGRINDLERYIITAQGASKRAAALTHRLLAFSRRQTLDPKLTDVNRLAAGMEELIRRTVGPAITVEVIAAGGLWMTLVDGPQLENALLNLCINARDAMPDGGRITIETGNKWLDQRAAHERELMPGQFVTLCVSDTGTGMTSEVMRRAFDPFYTTKPIGMGTGLGLSMVYGFARQSGGQVRIYSEPGQGAMICIYLPRHHGDLQDTEVPAPLSEASRPGQSKTVLVVDDEPTVRVLVTEVLEDLGHTAIEVADGSAGLKVLQSNARLDLLITDVGLPGMNGRQVADAARQVRPDIKVLFITGYAENAVIANGQLEPGMQVMTKPFAMETLAIRIKGLIADDQH